MRLFKTVLLSLILISQHSKAQRSALLELIEKPLSFDIPLYANYADYPKECSTALKLVLKEISLYKKTHDSTPLKKLVQNTEPKCQEVVRGSFLSESLMLMFPYEQKIAITLPLYLYKEGYLKLVDDLKVSGLHNNILGSYQCENTQINILIHQSPYDLAATVMHELDHLFRDKYTSEDFMNLESDVLFDETIANTTAGFYQLLAWERLNKPKLIKNENFNFFSEEGSILSIWNSIKDQGSFYFKSRTEHRGFLFFEELTGNESIDPRFNSIINLVSEAYFKQNPEKEFLSELSRKKIAAQESKLTSFITPTNTPVLRTHDFIEFETVLKQSSKKCRDRFGVGGLRPGVGGLRPGVGGLRPGVGGLRPTLPFDIYKQQGKHLCIDLKGKL